jgi:hypothetical protein
MSFLASGSVGLEKARHTRPRADVTASVAWAAIAKAKAGSAGDRAGMIRSARDLFDQSGPRKWIGRNKKTRAKRSRGSCLWCERRA